MILTGRDIQWYIEQGLLIIDPVEPEQFQQNGVDLYIKPSLYRLSNGNLSNVFHHGESYLTETIEYLALPNDLMAFVSIRSSWARKGIFPPGTIVDAGFKGTLTIELFNGGPGIVITEPTRIIHLVFAKLTGPSEPYKGKYQNQVGITLAKDDK